MKKSAASWWVLVAANIIASFWLWYFGVFHYVFETDMTYISGIIGVLYICVLLYLPVEFTSYKNVFSSADIYSRPYYIANHLPALGLLGTVIGLMFAVNVMAHMEINIEDPNSVLDMMKRMFSALGTSLITTIVGIILSLLLKIELMILDSIYKSE